MIRNIVYGLTAMSLVIVLAPDVRAENNFLDQFRYNPEYDKPKYKKYENKSRRIGNFGSSNNTYSGSANSGLFFESQRITQPGDIGIKREDQNTQIKLKIAF